MLRGSIAAAVAVVAVALVPGAAAADPPKIAFDGAFELSGTHGYEVSGLVASDGKVGSVALFVRKGGEEAIYSARGEGTADSIDVDLGRLGKVDVEARPSGDDETLRSDCDGKGKMTTIPGSELVGTIEFHGEEGFTEFGVTHTPLVFGPLLELVCGEATGIGTTSGEHTRGVKLVAKGAGGPSLQLEQNQPGAKVLYEAKMHEKEGPVEVSRTVSGHLGAGALRYDPSSLAGATFSAASPFSGTGTYGERSAPHETRPGRGSWRGSLKVDFPGDKGVRLAGPGFKASIIHSRRTETRE